MFATTLQSNMKWHALSMSREYYLLPFQEIRDDQTVVLVRI